MIKQNIVTFLFLTFFLTNVTAQDINQIDAKGERHGLWKKNFEGSDQPRYEGVFEHGREVGTFKFYKLVDGKSKLSATREFLPNSTKIQVKFYSSTGKLISEGMMDDKLFIGKWTYYQNKTKGILSTEEYNDKGQLHGDKLVYYENGKLAEKSTYVNGEIDGVSTWYSDNGTIVKEFTYKNGLLHGPSKYYNAKGQLLAEGSYKNDQKHGIWKYYENGKFTEEKDFTTYSKNPIKQ
ncbi:MAG: toxin-antitoxin system YwqK family antitoxin [Gelidibacter sp.]|nr:toxin-antitoxin system YwqK family antitoxin [Gelidibacter sp.]